MNEIVFRATAPVPLRDVFDLPEQATAAENNDLSIPALQRRLLAYLANRPGLQKSVGDVFNRCNSLRPR